MYDKLRNISAGYFAGAAASLRAKGRAAWALVSLAAAMAPWLCAQSAAPPPGEAPSSGPVFRVSVPLVVLDAVVVDPHTGQPIGGLTAADFEIEDDGEPQTITYFAQDEFPLSIVFMFDLTDTVRPVLRTLGAAAEGILENLKPQDEVAVEVFSSTAELVEAFTTDRHVAAAAIERASGMKSREGTFLNESVYRVALECLKSSSPNDRRVIVCLTDGTVNIPSERMRRSVGRSVPAGQLHTEEEAKRALIECGASFNAIIERSALSDFFLVAKYMDPTTLDGRLYPPGDVRKYAELAGGVVLTSHKKETAGKLGALLKDLRSRYTLGYRPAQELAAGSFCRVSLKLTAQAAARVGNPMVRTRSGYYR